MAAAAKTPRTEAVAHLKFARMGPRKLRRVADAIRGMGVRIEMNEVNFAGEGDMYIFASVLNEFFALYASINALTELTVHGVKFGEIYKWPPRLGQQGIL